ncbi:hypothetical protein HS125_08320 [bacterium]|nr:hypothetical protein [bacterium]
MHLARPAEELENPSTQPSGGLYGWLLWLVVLLPVFILVKAPLTCWVMGVSENLQVAGRPGLGTGAAGTPVAVAWLLLMAALIPLRGWAEKAAECLCRARARWAIAVVVALEAATVAFYLATAEDTLRRGLPAFQEHVAAGETVAGRLSATLFHSRPVHTVRSASPESDPDEFDWAAVRERYHPRYVALVETTGGVRDMDYTLILEELRNDGYRPAARMEVGPMLRRGPRYAFVLFERGTDE